MLQIWNRDSENESGAACWGPGGRTDTESEDFNRTVRTLVPENS